MQQVDLNAFFLKHLLWIPSNHPFNIYRLALWFFIALPSLRQVYIFVSDPDSTSLGRSAPLFLFLFLSLSLSLSLVYICRSANAVTYMYV